MGSAAFVVHRVLHVKLIPWNYQGAVSGLLLCRCKMRAEYHVHTHRLF